MIFSLIITTHIVLYIITIVVYTHKDALLYKHTIVHDDNNNNN